MEKRIYHWMKQYNKPASLKRMQRELSLSSSSVKSAVETLVRQGRLVMSGSTRFSLPSGDKILHGRLRIDRQGRMHFVSEEGERFRVVTGGLHGGRHEDEVRCRILPRRGKTPPQAVVREVTGQAHEVVTGRYNVTAGGAMVHCLDQRLGKVRITKQAKACDGDLVSVRITSVPSDSGLPARGTVESVLGDGNDAAGYLRAVAVSHGIPLYFDEAVLAEAEALPEITKDALKGRKDLRGLTVFTIDGADAKDLDDAVSLEELKNGNRRLGVHIADVSHYVRPGGALDAAGYERGNSTYLPGLTLPMLPERLSNGLCSLWPDKDKLTLSALLDFDGEGRLVGRRIVRSVIRSRARLTYDEVLQLLEGRKGKNAGLMDTLKKMDALRAQLKARRIADGALDFDLPEPYFVTGEDGWAQRIEKRMPDRATQVIEEFMLAANRAVATLAFEENLPVVYRTHPVPDEEKAGELWRFLAGMGYSGRGASPKQLQRVIKAAKGKPEEHVVNYAILRAMQKAVYSATDDGHYGLAFTHYCHFTSPIRRYSDLATHRALKAHIEGRKPAGASEIVAKRCTNCEIASMESEREAHDLLKAQYMQSRLGEVYDGVVSGVTNFGIFVELDNTVEGLVHITALNNDYYAYDESARTLTGERTGKRYSLGQAVRVQVAAARLAPPSVDLVLHEGA
jgi:ribonuclease R